MRVFAFKYHRPLWGRIPRRDRLLKGRIATILSAMDSPPIFMDLHDRDPGGKMMKDVLRFTGIKLKRKHSFGSSVKLVCASARERSSTTGSRAGGEAGRLQPAGTTIASAHLVRLEDLTPRPDTKLPRGTLFVLIGRLLLPAGAALAGLALLAPIGAVAARSRVPRPRIVWKPIPFTAARRAEMAAYAHRHYGINSWGLRNPHVIVEHYTANISFQATWNTFAADSPDPELHELPGDCTHYVIDTDGTIYQLVPLTTMCRHTVGLNYTAIGIEHVGTSDHEILHNPRQLHASLALTLWLMQRFHITLANVIGHNESLNSPYHHERYPAWRCQTHQDWQRHDMITYRNHLRALARRYRLKLGPQPELRPTGC